MHSTLSRGAGGAARPVLVSGQYPPHCHSFWNDGTEFPEMIADWYKQHGYDFLAISDHSVLMEGERWRDTKRVGKPREMLKEYSADVGKVFCRVEGLQASFQLTGEELYVRAVVRSDVRHANPPENYIQTKIAWCQPVGWEKRAK